MGGACHHGRRLAHLGRAAAVVRCGLDRLVRAPRRGSPRHLRHQPARGARPEGTLVERATEISRGPRTRVGRRDSRLRWGMTSTFRGVFLNRALGARAIWRAVAPARGRARHRVETPPGSAASVTRSREAGSNEARTFGPPCSPRSRGRSGLASNRSSGSPPPPPAACRSARPSSLWRPRGPPARRGSTEGSRSPIPDDPSSFDVADGTRATGAASRQDRGRSLRFPARSHRRIGGRRSWAFS